MHEGASQYLDNAVLHGSRGFQADTPAELGTNDNNFFVMSTPDDPIPVRPGTRSTVAMQGNG